MYLISRRRFAVFSFVCLLLIFSQTAFAIDKDDWRPVSPAELAMKTPQVEADADAEAIFWEVRIDDSDSSGLSKRHYVRVKIFTERGREKFSKFDIPYVKGIKIKDVAARVIKPDGTIVEIQKTDIFEREIVKTNKIKVKAKSFAIPNIEPGVIVEYQYREVIDHAGASGMELPFQRDIPIQTLSYYYKPYKKKEPNYQPFNFSDTKFVEENNGYYLARRTNIPSFKEEPYMPPENNVRPWMLLQNVAVNLVNIENHGFNTTYSLSIKNPNNPGLYWASVAAEYAGLAGFMNKKDKAITKTAQEITASASSDDEKLRKLYEFCQTQIKNVSFDPSMTDEQRADLPKIKKLEDVLKNKAASNMYIDLLFGALANSLGFDTRIVVAPDRSEVFFNPNMTNESFVQPRSVAVKVDDKWKFFNPGVSFLPYGKLVWYEEDVWALLVGEEQNNWEKTPLSNEKDNLANRSGKLKLTEDGTLEGDIRIEYVGQAALTYRLENYDESASKIEDNLKEEITKRISTAEISNIKIENINDYSKPIVQQYKIRVPNYAQKTGKRLFLQPGFFEYGESPVFSASNRKYDIYFPYAQSEIDNIEIQLPAGFQLDNAEKPADFVEPKGVYALRINISVDKEATLMKYTRKFHFGGGGLTLFNVSNYPALKTIFDTFQKSDTHTITLKQAN